MSEPETPSLRKLEDGECPCAACGIACPLPDLGLDERGKRLPPVHNRRDVLLIPAEPRNAIERAHPESARKWILTRCQPCLARLDAWSAWPGLPVDAAERAACAAEMLGFTGSPGRELLDAADLSLASLRDPRTFVRFIDKAHEEGGAELLGSCSLQPWSHLSGEDRGALRAVRAEAFARAMREGEPPPPVPCPPALRRDIAHRAANLEAIDGGCLICGVESVPAGKAWTHKTVSPAAFSRRGGPKMVVGHTCHVCSSAVQSYGFGIGAIDEALSKLGMRMPIGSTTDGQVKTYAFFVLRDRLAGREGLLGGYGLPFNWIRVGGELPAAVLVNSPEPDYSGAVSFNPRQARENARLAALPAPPPKPQQVIHTREVVTKVVREPITVDDARGVLLADTLARNAAAKRAADKAAVARLAGRSGR